MADPTYRAFWPRLWGHPTPAQTHALAPAGLEVEPALTSVPVPAPTEVGTAVVPIDSVALAPTEVGTASPGWGQFFVGLAQTALAGGLGFLATRFFLRWYRARQSTVRLGWDEVKRRIEAIPNGNRGQIVSDLLREAAIKQGLRPESEI